MNRHSLVACMCKHCSWKLCVHEPSVWRRGQGLVHALPLLLQQKRCAFFFFFLFLLPSSPLSENQFLFFPTDKVRRSRPGGQRHCENHTQLRCRQFHRDFGARSRIQKRPCQVSKATIRIRIKLSRTMTNSRSHFRRFKHTDVPSSVSKAAPDFCTVYVIAKGKISSVRSASSSARLSSRPPRGTLILSCSCSLLAWWYSFLIPQQLTEHTLTTKSR